MNTLHTIQDFLEVKSAGNPSFSPDGKTIAYLSNDTGTFQLYLASRDGGGHEQVIFYNDQIAFALFSPTKNEVIFGMAKGGNEKTQYFLLDAASKEIVPITDDPEVMHKWLQWSPDGQSIAYSSNKRNGTDFDVYVMNLITREQKLIFKE